MRGSFLLAGASAARRALTGQPAKLRRLDEEVKSTWSD
jgi:hypothetical protein